MGAPALNWLFRLVITAAVLAAASVVVSLPIPPVFRVILLGAGLAGTLVLAFRYLPGFDPFGRVRWRLRPASDGIPRCALTFDDGPSAATEELLDILAAEGVRATFFLLGANVSRHPGIVRRMQADGHVVGIHGMRHQKLGSATADDVEREIEQLEAVLSELGVSASPIYRTPHGVKSPAVFEAATRRGLALWAWSRGIWDTDRPAPEVLVRRATRWARPGLVLLLHDGRGEEIAPDISSMLAALPGIIRAFKRRGFRFVTLTDQGCA